MTATHLLLKITVLLVLVTVTNSARGQMHMAVMKDTGQPLSGNVFLRMMDTMMVQMNHTPKAVTPQKDFIFQMMPHHGGAINMARYEILHGHNSEMIQLAKSILTEQSSEIEQMSLWLELPEKASSDFSDYRKEMAGPMEKMMLAMPADTAIKNIDQAFAVVMIPHHQAAIDMARVLLKYETRPELTGYGKQLISNEQVEIEQMKEFLSQ